MKLHTPWRPPSYISFVRYIVETAEEREDGWMQFSDEVSSLLLALCGTKEEVQKFFEWCLEQAKEEHAAYLRTLN